MKKALVPFVGEMLRLVPKALGLLLVFAAFAGTAAARQGLPEIDPGSAPSALTLLVGGTLLLVDRFRRN